MRETLINDTKLPSFSRRNNTLGNDLSNINILDSGDSCFSFELCPNRNLDTKLLAKLKPRFCSVTWLAQDHMVLDNIEEIPALQLSEELARQGNSIALHLAGRNLSEADAVRILRKAKDIGVGNILALQGGS